MCKTASLHVAHGTARQSLSLADLVIKHKHMHGCWEVDLTLHLGARVYLGSLVHQVFLSSLRNLSRATNKELNYVFTSIAVKG